LQYYYKGINDSRKDFERTEIPVVDITHKSNDFLEKIMKILNENKEPEEWVLKPDIVTLALEDYAKKLSIK